jgi:hypothetical protein
MQCVQINENEFNFTEIKMKKRDLNEEVNKGLCKKSHNPLASNNYPDLKTLKKNLYEYAVKTNFFLLI